MTYNSTRSTIHLINQRSSSLFLIFTGNAHRLMIEPVRFLRATGIASHNILMFRDCYKNGYHDGISRDVSTLDALVTFIQQYIQLHFSHVKRLFAVGTSSGAYPAIYCGYNLSIHTVWTFGGRICRKDAVRNRNVEIRKLVFKAIGRNAPNRVGPITYTSKELAAIRSTAALPEYKELLWNVTENPQFVLDQDSLGQLSRLVANHGGQTSLNLYYSPENLMDSVVARTFQGFARVHLHSIASQSEHTEDALFGRAPTHIVIKTLEEEGRLESIFRDII